MDNSVSKADLQQTASRICAYMLEDHRGNWGMDIHEWDWVPGVGVIAILSYYEATRLPQTLEALTRWTADNLHKAEKQKVINSAAPFAIFPELYRQTGDPLLLQTAARIGDWMLTEAPRTREGAWEHTVTENASFPEQVWADTVFMAVLFMARLGRLTGDSRYTGEALRQLELHLKLLQEESTGVLFHGWNCMEGNHMSGARWARANAWVALAAPMILEELADLKTVPAGVKERYAKLMRGLIRFQRADGMWSTVLDRPDFYAETSGTAGIACGIWKAVRLNLLEEDCTEAADRALKAVLGTVLPSGEVTGVSSGTPVMPTIEAYNHIPLHATLYGQGLALMLLAEKLSQSGG
ncbi:unsaturated rhamnogalacturonyl hydrolase [Paenibacillus sp. UNCCL117]|uniref:glycoside hydrolase family 88/105 protein n=1 Tax=unclassified Paenibacillus TaxID=185978 RepID=UPI000890F004|nr:MULTISPECIES: glycoside hydrolase family 88 protein [unclassified Paenibacillus]SDC63125.1 unsaturated rhamnogalacturonyl hydrolase [Paenibacillus sp. cl123]SFW22213.1 unsaturated rhamnogalacturonyl hydrolase [Paenibacillus sp. UNCCL117]